MFRERIFMRDPIERAQEDRRAQKETGPDRLAWAGEKRDAGPKGARELT